MTLFINPKKKLTQNGSVLTDFLRERTRIDTTNARNIMGRHPFAQANSKLPMGRLLAQFVHNQTGHPNFIDRFKPLGQSEVVLFRFGRNAIVTDQRIGKDQNLSMIRWVGH